MSRRHEGEGETKCATDRGRCRRYGWKAVGSISILLAPSPVCGFSLSGGTASQITKHPSHVSCCYVPVQERAI